MDQGATRQDGTITLLVKHDATIHHNTTHVEEEVVMTMAIITMTIITMVIRDTQHKVWIVYACMCTKCVLT